ncbi:hypothetical protein DFR70_102937 [Nocardia tenerifensis]|uniref:Xaa-Pro dipeptidyl-peptidase C-terminal domain-containing protein n=1 Tax=Nocardia tenerifensis TaxID=228006 RepID=A0A318K7C6_9NOCA|nr:CocE/NonD family hydrolase [Nocardia tenerifensis]PXX69248.1 hypothetical protein DFR70_102937 [Nocardia tenerifensis]
MADDTDDVREHGDGVGTLPPGTRFDIGDERYSHIHRYRDIPIRMSDGTVLYADIGRPGDGAGPVGEPLPVVVTFTAYNKRLIQLAGSRGVRAVSRAARWMSRRPVDTADVLGVSVFLQTLAHGAPDAISPNETLIRRGYVYVLVDSRGTGSSLGGWNFIGTQERRDYLEVFGWLRDQSWCRGEFALAGISYHAMAALAAAGLRPEGLKAVFAIEGAESADREIAFTGGLLSPFVIAWSAAVNAVKFIPPVHTLLRDSTLISYVRDRLAAPLPWFDRTISMYLSRDDPDLYRNEKWEERRPRLESIEVPTFLVGGWRDIFNRSPLRIYEQIDVPPGRKQVLVDNSFHFTPGFGFGTNGNPPALDELQCAWLNRWVNNESNGIDGYGPIVLHQLNGPWVARTEFPHPAAQPVRLYLSADNSGSAGHAGYDGTLALSSPPADQSIALPHSGVQLSSDNTAIATGGLSTLFGRYNADERRAEKSAATFTTIPFATDTVLSGPMNVHLFVETTGHEAVWVVTLSRVARDGTSIAMARGTLRSALRELDEANSRYADGELIEPQHPLTAESLQEVRPGEIHRIDIGLNATEAVIDTGDRLRLSIQCASFPRHALPLGMRRSLGTQTIQIHPRRPCYLTLCEYPKQS